LTCGWNATLYQNLKFNFARDVVPVASTVKTYNVMVVNPSFPAKTIPELIAYAKANPGKLNMDSAVGARSVITPGRRSFRSASTMSRPMASCKPLRLWMSAMHRPFRRVPY
jgi:tripartite tricarboxylate transporter family receptor